MVLLRLRVIFGVPRQEQQRVGGWVCAGVGTEWGLLRRVAIASPQL